MLKKNGFIFLLLLGSHIGAATLQADTIVLKDGSTEESDRIWESENYIHFILKGTRTVEIRYAKEIVARIERNTPSRQAISKPSVAPDPNAELHPPQKQKRVVKSQSVAPSSSPEQNLSKHESIDPTLIEEGRGVSFYDPRRPRRYWASRRSKHTTLEAALAALAQQYGRSIQWVETYLGQENDLGIIHANLMRQIVAETSASGHAARPHSASLDLFFDERSPLPYRVGPDQAYKTQAEAIAALAGQYENSAQWVRRHMGTTNHLAEIHQNLASAKAQSASTSDATAISTGSQAPSTPPKGILFYDPRRAEKYWTSQVTRHNSLSDAIAALASQYGVSPQWIESHMGDTNDLAEIHHHIQTNLKKK